MVHDGQAAGSHQLCSVGDTCRAPTVTQDDGWFYAVLSLEILVASDFDKVTGTTRYYLQYYDM